MFQLNPRIHVIHSFIQGILPTGLSGLSPWVVRVRTSLAGGCKSWIGLGAMRGGSEGGIIRVS